MKSLNQYPGWQHFIKCCQEAQSVAEFDELFEVLLTHEEREQLAIRVAVLRGLLVEQKPQRQIASELGVGIATITRGSNVLKLIKPKLKAFLMKFL